MYSQQQQPRTQIELYIECSNLKNLDLLSKSDPRVLVYTASSQQQQQQQQHSSSAAASSFSLFGKTEQIKDNLNPKFTTTFRMDYIFEVEQRLKFVVVDDDEDNGTNDDFIGQCVTTLGKIVSQGNEKGLVADLISKRGNIHGQIRVRAVPMTALQSQLSRDELRLSIRGKSLAKKDFGLFAKSDPYYQIQLLPSSIDGSSSAQPLMLYQSEIIKRNLNPTWDSATVNMSKFSQQQSTTIDQVLNQPIRIVVWDWDQLTAHDLIGQVDTTLNQLLLMAKDTSSSSLKLVDDKGKYGGDIVVSGCSIARTYSFLDYLQLGRCELSLIVSVDFTGSNGDPRDRNSLHYIAPYPALNEYQNAIWSIGNILSAYDSDQLFPSYGFGAYLPSSGTSHCFPLTLNNDDVECRGVDGIMQAYSRCVSGVSLSGPTNFAPTIKTVVQRYTKPALATMGESLKYYILLILTDGEITDMEETIRQIQQASDTPLSIVIVGVGSANFDSMDTLDGDDGQLKTKRDIVQFVPYRKFSAKGPEELARETLREIPAQVEKFFKMRNVDPTVYQNRYQ